MLGYRVSLVRKDLADGRRVRPEAGEGEGEEVGIALLSVVGTLASRRKAASDFG